MPLGEFAEFKNGINFGKDQKGEIGVPTIDVRNMYGRGITVDLANLYRVSKKVSSEQTLQRNDLLFVRSSLKREGIGWTSLFTGANEPISFCGFIIRARLINGTTVDPTFLTYFCRSDQARSQLIAGSGKVAITNISQDVLARLPIPIPPVDEQRKIAAVLGLVQRAMEQQEWLLALTAELKKALLQQLLTHGLRHEPRKQTEIAPIPQSWEVGSVGEVAQIKGGKRLPKGEKFAETATPFPYIRVTDFDNFSVRTSDLKYLRPETQSAIKRYTISAKDVYISIAGSTGITGMVPAKLDGANLTENAAKLVVTKPAVDARFLMYFLASDGAQKEIRSQTVKNAQPKLALARIATLRVPFPKFDEQKEIAASIDAVAIKEQLHRRKHVALTALFRTLLHELMTARIRVHDLDLEGAV